VDKLVAWFDIPVADMTRAIKFYERLTGRPLKRIEMGGGKSTALFGPEGCLFQSPEDKPSHFGSRVYFNADPDINEWIKRVETAGGKILVPRTPTGDEGVFAYFEDSEGNRVGLHAAK
jgi:predicted enzyme related to lactoylglutathione lyase